MLLPITESERDFRNDNELRKYVVELRASPLFRRVEEVFQAAHPIRQRPPSQNDGDKNVLLGRVYGFQEGLDIWDRLELPLPKALIPVHEDWGTDAQKEE